MRGNIFCIEQSDQSVVVITHCDQLVDHSVLSIGQDVMINQLIIVFITNFSIHGNQLVDFRFFINSHTFSDRLNVAYVPVTIQHVHIW